MKIENKMLNKQSSFNNIAEGEAFMLDDEVFMKTPICYGDPANGATHNAISLKSGEFYFIGGGLMVVPVKATVVVERG